MKVSRGFQKDAQIPFHHRQTLLLFSLSFFLPTTMATETQSAPATPELTALNRVASIPLVNDTFSAVHTSLISHRLTRSPYSTAQALSLSALRASEPITVYRSERRHHQGRQGALGICSRRCQQDFRRPRPHPCILRCPGYRPSTYTPVSRYPYATMICSFFRLAKAARPCR